MPRRHIVLGNRHKAGQACLGGEQVVAVRVERPIDRTVADRQQPALRIEQESELHRLGHRVRARLQASQTQPEALEFILALRDIAARTGD